ncbi:MAG: hypothetical protein ABI026_10825 [Gemmatimonadaceae bacterium]
MIALATALLVTISAEGRAQSSDEARQHSVHVTGEFRSDGTCQVFADSAPVFQPSDSAASTYIQSGTINVAPPGFDAHEIWCEPHSGGEPKAGLLPTDRVFVVMLYAPTGKLAEPRNYVVRFGLPSRDVAPYRAGAALFGMSAQMINDTLPLHSGAMYMVGSSGTVSITRVEGGRVTGKFDIRTKRALTL